MHPMNVIKYKCKHFLSIIIFEIICIIYNLGQNIVIRRIQKDIYFILNLFLDIFIKLIANMKR
jgi:hypothetical protein